MPPSSDAHVHRLLQPGEPLLAAAPVIPGDPQRIHRMVDRPTSTLHQVPNRQDKSLYLALCFSLRPAFSPTVGKLLSIRPRAKLPMAVTPPSNSAVLGILYSLDSTSSFSATLSLDTKSVESRLTRPWCPSRLPVSRSSRYTMITLERSYALRSHPDKPSGDMRSLVSYHPTAPLKRRGGLVHSQIE